MAAAGPTSYASASACTRSPIAARLAEDTSIIAAASALAEPAGTIQPVSRGWMNSSVAPTGIGGYHRQPCRHRLENYHTPRFMQRWEDQHIALGQDLRNLPVRYSPEPADR